MTDPGRFEDLVSRCLDAGLGPAEERELLALLEDPGRARTFAELARLDGEVAGLLASPVADEEMVDLVRREIAGSAPPEGDSTRMVRIMAQVRQEAQPSRRPRGRLRAGRESGPAALAWGWGAVAASFLVAVALAVMSRPGTESPAPGPREEAKAPPVVEIPREHLRPGPPATGRPTAPPPTVPENSPGDPRTVPPLPRENPLRPEPPREEPPQPPAPRVDTVEAVAQLERVTGEVRLAGVPARAGDGLPAGRSLDVGRDGLATLKFPDGTRLELGPDSSVREIGEGPKKVVIDRGRLDADVVKQKQPMTIATSHAEVKVVGTRLAVLAAAASTRVEVSEGLVQVTKAPRGPMIRVAAGQYAVAGPGLEFAARPIQPEEIVVKFGAPGTKAPEGALLDTGEEFDAARGYGWRGPNRELPGIVWKGEAVRQRAPAERPALDALRGSYLCVGWKGHAGTWSMRLPNGRYLVTVVAGAPSDPGGPHHVWIEGAQVIDATTTARGEFLERKEVPVLVRDGELTLVAGGHRSDKTCSDGCSDTNLQYLVVKPDLRKR